MSRSKQDWDRELAIAISMRHKLRCIYDELESIDCIRFCEVADPMMKIETDLSNCLEQFNQVCGALIYSPDGVIE